MFIDLGYSFYGYISQVSVWKTVLSWVESFEIYNDKLAVPQADSLQLGWTPYSYNPLVLKIVNSTAASGPVSICSIPNTIAKKGLNSPDCKNKVFTGEWSHFTEPKILPLKVNESVWYNIGEKETEKQPALSAKISSFGVEKKKTNGFWGWEVLYFVTWLVYFCPLTYLCDYIKLNNMPSFSDTNTITRVISLLIM